MPLRFNNASSHQPPSQCYLQLGFGICFMDNYSVCWLSGYYLGLWLTIMARANKMHQPISKGPIVTSGNAAIKVSIVRLRGVHTMAAQGDVNLPPIASRRSRWVQSPEWSKTLWFINLSHWGKYGLITFSSSDMTLTRTPFCLVHLCNIITGDIKGTYCDLICISINLL